MLTLTTFNLQKRLSASEQKAIDSKKTTKKELSEKQKAILEKLNKKKTAGS
jgi:hypothetical protein